VFFLCVNSSLPFGNRVFCSELFQVVELAILVGRWVGLWRVSECLAGAFGWHLAL